MNHKLITYNQPNRRLLLFFAGWGMDANPLSTLHRDGYDTLILWNYASPSFPTDIVERYDEICVMAWSFGVYHASQFISDNPELPITRTIAVNGTLQPIDDENGIPTDIFEGTRQNMSERNLTKFYRRMCKDADSFSEFSSVRPRRDADELAKELECIWHRWEQLGHSGSIGQWDAVYISDDDRIIPTSNQMNAWAGHGNIKMLNEGHWADFNRIAQAELIDKMSVARRFEKSFTTYNHNAVVQEPMALRLAEALAEATKGQSIGDMLEIGAGEGLFTLKYMKFISPANLLLCDIRPIADPLPGTHIQADGELLVRKLKPESTDILATSSTIQWFNSIPLFINECKRIVRQGGTIAISTFGPQTFKEINPLIPSPLSYPSLKMLTELLSDGFDILTAEESTESLQFKSTQKLLEHMRLTGVNSAAPNNSRLTSARQILRHGITRLTYQPIFIVGRKR